ncbi:uncharacterized protein F4822DRAFT_413432 [Hypoxylon trugodes]|uniref:uncharacterized protein n=1 Tax=Hypoxylon trugodes TaxID=326681 RepID=UPI0021902FB9|nr:uncharacterized protein F4822DRAFT_413432 [Hypoxylon trugodes]KAI1385559.1 hypothetical protein F4822DRAFT_413432 [Hypoxylon trugodes]
MAPTKEDLKTLLRDGVRAFVAERGSDQVTTNSVRQYVEEKNGLEKGFFRTSEWKDSSKDIIQDSFNQLGADEEESASSPVAKVKPEPKNGVKRQSSDDLTPSPKRQKKTSRATSSKKAKSKKEESESELSDLGSLSDPKEPAKAAPKKATTKKAAKKEDSDSELSDLVSSEQESKKAAPKKAASRRKSKKEETESELSDLSDSEEKPKNKKKVPKKAAPRRKSKNGVKDEADSDVEKVTTTKRKRQAPIKKQKAKDTKVESDSEDDLADGEKGTAKDEVDEDLDGGVKSKTSPETKDKSKTEESDEDSKPKELDGEDSKAAKADDSGSELSSLIDEPIPKKRKSKGAKGAPKPKQTKEPSGDEAEIKKLQGQLVKCGVRKIWGIELKKYGDNSRAKIRHLKEMLRDIGIESRFSEAKAKEIKEKRELMADLEAVTEMNRNWGTGAGRGRASRSQSTKKPSKEIEDEEDDVMDDVDDNGDEEEEEEVKANPRVSKRMADLAFLGSDSESD